MKFPPRSPLFAFIGMLTACGGGSATSEAVAVVAAPTAAATPTPTPADPTSSVAKSTAAIAPAMTLGAVTHFAQGWDLSVVTAARTLGVSTVRDEVSWADVEKSAGVYDYTSSRVAYPDSLLDSGIQPTLLFQGGNPNYDSGYTPYTDQGRAAFARFVVKTLDRFPRVQTIEIGNEYNSNDFVTGPVHDAGYGQRQQYYTQMLKAVYEAVKSSHPSVRVLGGAAHSIPVGYFKTLFADGALNYMDALVIHPYTTAPEELAKQIAVLRTAMASNPKPIVVTEFETEIDSARDTASYLVKAVSQLAAAGVSEADWYALRQEGTPSNTWYKNVGLVTFDGQLTQSGQAFKLVASRLIPEGAARRLTVDDFTYAIKFGDNAMVIWGEPRSLSVQADVRCYDVLGNEIAAPASISSSEPIVLVGSAGINLGTNVRLGSISLVADTANQFNYNNDQSGPWSYWIYHAAVAKFEPTYSEGGGEIQSSIWTPYLGSDWLRPFSIGATSVLPVDFGSASSPDIYKPVVRYTATMAGSVRVTGDLTVRSSSADGIDFVVQINGRTVLTNTFKGQYNFQLSNLSVSVGDKIDFIFGTNQTASGGDDTAYRFRVFAS